MALLPLYLSVALQVAPVGEPAETPRRARLIVLDLADNARDPELARTLGEVIASALGAGPFDVTTVSDLRATADVDAQRQAVGDCSDSAACMAEIAAALGAEVLVHGSVGRLSDRYVVSVAMFDSTRSHAIARENVKASDPALLARNLEIAGARLIAAYEGKPLPPPPPDDAAAGPSAATVMLYGGAAVGVVGAAAAVGGGLVALNSASVLDDPAGTRAAKDEAVTSWATSTTVFLVGTGASVVGIGAAVASLFVE